MSKYLKKITGIFKKKAKETVKEKTKKEETEEVETEPEEVTEEG
ncbi:MAG: hypothetical protein ACXAC7_18330 [Candidatus Hodarchaeales archaeon]|jgi:hypothetical protein